MRKDVGPGRTLGLGRRWTRRDALRIRTRARCGNTGAVSAGAQPQRLQDLRPRHGRAAGRHGQRGRPLPRGVQEVGAGTGRRHGSGHHRGDTGRTRPDGAVAPDERTVRGAGPAHLPDHLPRGRHPLPPGHVGGGAGCSRRRVLSNRSIAHLLVHQRTLQQRGRLPAPADRPRPRIQQHQQLLLLLP